MKTAKKINNSLKDNGQLSSVERIELSRLNPSPYNPRKYFDPDSLTELAENIKQVGIIQPITVRPLKKDQYEIVCGERRYRASLLAEIKDIPAIVRHNMTDEQAEDIAYFENLQRKDILPIEEAAAIKYYIDKRKENFKSLSKRLGKSEVYVRTRYSLNNLTNELQEMLNRDEIQIGMALIIASYEEDIQLDIYKNHLAENAYNSWRGYSYQKFVRTIEHKYSMSLLDVEFDRSECANCSFNSSLAQLFGDENPKCLKSVCFIEKQKEHEKKRLLSIIEQFPDYPIYYYHANIPDWLFRYAQEHEIEIVNSYDWEKYPEMPKMPSVNDWTDEKGELIEEDFDEANDEYNELMIDYNRQTEEIQKMINENRAGKCLIYANATFSEGYYTIEEEELEKEQENTEDNTPEQITHEDNEKTLLVNNTRLLEVHKFEKQKVEALKNQDARNLYIKKENILREVKVLFDDKNIEETDKTDFETQIFYVIMTYESDVCKNRFFCKRWPTLEEVFEMSKLFSENDKIFIVREFIKKYLCSYSTKPDMFSTELLTSFAMQHFPAEMTNIEDKYNKVYEVRKTKIEEEIKALEEIINEKPKDILSAMVELETA